MPSKSWGDRESFESRRKSLPGSSGGVPGAAGGTADSIIWVPGWTIWVSGQKSDGILFEGNFGFGGFSGVGSGMRIRPAWILR